MKAMTAYEINIFQTFIFTFNCKNQTVSLILQNLFTIKPRDKYAITATNMLLESLCQRKFSKLKISFRGPHLRNKLITPNAELSNMKNLTPFHKKLEDMIVSIQNFN